MGGWLDSYVAGSVVASIIITRRNNKKNNKDDFGLVQGSRGQRKAKAAASDRPSLMLLVCDCCLLCAWNSIGWMCWSSD